MRKLTVAGLIAVAAVGTAATLAIAGSDDRQAPPPVLDSSAPSSTPLDDATIIAIFDAANSADIESGALAATRGSSASVRDFGAQLARDHQQVRKLGRDLAARLGVTPTPPSDDQAARDHAAAMQRLGSLSGAEFDRAFLEHEVAFHAAVIDAVQTTLLPAITNAELKDLVVRVAPAFEAHRLAAQNRLRDLPASAAHPGH